MFRRKSDLFKKLETFKIFRKLTLSMQRINHNSWIKGKSYQKRILVDTLKENVNLIEDVIVSPHGIIPEHNHGFTDELFYIVDGFAIMIVNNEKFKVSPGEMIYINKNESHGFRNESNEEFKMLVIKINFQKGDSFLK